MEANVFHRPWQHIEHPEAARILVNTKIRRYLLPFMAGERSMSEAAQELAVSTQALGYWVRRFRKAGLLELTSAQPRRGRPVKRYRTVAQGFFLPFQKTTASTLEALIAEQTRPWNEVLYRSTVRSSEDAIRDVHRWGLRVTMQEGMFCLDVAPGPEAESLMGAPLLKPEAPALWAVWTSLRLDFEDAKALQRDMAELLDRYSGKHGSQDYLVHLALAPLEKPK